MYDLKHVAINFSLALISNSQSPGSYKFVVICFTVACVQVDLLITAYTSTYALCSSSITARSHRT